MKTILALTLLSLMMLPIVARAQEDSHYPSVDAPSSSSHSPATAPSGTGTGIGRKSGGTTQTCTDSCNRSYDGCMDHNAAIPGNDFTLNSSNNAANSIVGGTSGCSDDLRSCLNTCGG